MIKGFKLFHQGKINNDKKYFCDNFIDFYEIGHKKNNYYFTYLLGCCYNFGMGVDEDLELAFYYYNLASKNNVVKAMRGLGSLYLDKNDLENGLFWLSKAYENNDLYSGYRLGLLYYRGRLIDRDYKKAYEYFFATKAVKTSAYMLGECYYYGNGVETDYAKAIEYFKYSEYSKAYYMIGSIYHKNLNDINEAMEYYSLAVEYDDDRARLELGIILFENNDYEASIKYLEPMALNGNSKALGYLYKMNYFNVK